MADTEHRRARRRVDAVEEPEEGGFPLRVLEDALRAGRYAVVLAWVERAGAARADHERKPRGKRRHGEASAHVVADDPDRRRPGAALPRVVRVVEEALHDRRVPEIRVAVVHVENRHVHEALLRRRFVAGCVHPDVGEPEPRRNHDLGAWNRCMDSRGSRILAQTFSSLSVRVMRLRTASVGVV